MVNEQRRYTFPFVSHSASYLEDLGDQFWIIGDSSPQVSRQKSRRKPSQQIQEPISQADPGIGPSASEKTPGKKFRPCLKLKKFKSEKMDPVFRTVQTFIEDKATNASENIRVAREVIKSEEFKEIRSKFSEGRYEYEPRSKYNKCPSVQRLRHAISDTKFLFKVRKSQWF